MQVTRQRIVDYLRKNGQATVEELTKTVALTHMAVRHHLNVLQAEGLITVSTTRRDKKPGRPVQIYILTENAEKLYPQDYFQLTDLLLEELINRVGEEEAMDIFSSMAERMLAVAPTPRKGQSFESRLDEVIQFLKEKGFATRWDIEDGNYVIHHVSCPYRRLASRHPEVCLLDEQVIGTMLGVPLSRTCSIAENDSKCTYCLGTPTSVEN